MRTLSQQHEFDIVTMFQNNNVKAQLQPGSGNQSHNPNDIYAKNRFMVECKATTHETILVKLAWIKRLVERSMLFGLPGILAIRFKPKAFMSGNWDFFVIDATYFMHLLECERQVCNKE